jgi:DnaJ homolog subfamily A member 2
VIVVVKIRPSKIFSRKGADLYMDKEISLVQALTGVNFVILHLDGRAVRIMGKEGQVIKPNSVMTCEGLGLPFHKTSYKSGNLFINFKIAFPETITPNQKDVITNVLKSQKKSSSEQE